MDRRKERRLRVDLDVARGDPFRAVRASRACRPAPGRRRRSGTSRGTACDRIASKSVLPIAVRRPSIASLVDLLDRHLGRLDLVDAPVGFDGDHAPARSLEAVAASRLDGHQWTGGRCLDERAPRCEEREQQQTNHVRHRPG